MCVRAFISYKAGSKRGREEGDEEEESSRPETSHTPPTSKKLRLKPTTMMQVGSNACTHTQLPGCVTLHLEYFHQNNAQVLGLLLS